MFKEGFINKIKCKIKKSISAALVGVITVLPSGIARAADNSIYISESSFVSDGTTTVTSENVYTDFSGINNGKIEITIGSSVIRTASTVFDFGTPAYIQQSSNSAMLPLRAVSTAAAGLGNGSAVSVEWDNAAKTAVINNNGDIIRFTAGSGTYTVNGTAYAIDNGAYAEIVNSTMFVPLRALSTALGAKTDWDNSTKTVTLYK